MLPATVLYVYAGSLAKSVTTVASGGSVPGWAARSLLAVGFVATVALLAADHAPRDAQLARALGRGVAAAAGPSAHERLVRRRRRDPRARRCGRARCPARAARGAARRRKSSWSRAWPTRPWRPCAIGTRATTSRPGPTAARSSTPVRAAQAPACCGSCMRMRRCRAMRSSVIAAARSRGRGERLLSVRVPGAADVVQAAARAARRAACSLRRHGVWRSGHLRAPRRVLCACGGFAEWPLFEEVRLVRRLRARGTFRVLPRALAVATRRWERDGWLKRTLHNRWLALRFALGGRPEALAASYRHCYARTRSTSHERRATIAAVSPRPASRAGTSSRTRCASCGFTPARPATWRARSASRVEARRPAARPHHARGSEAVHRRGRGARRRAVLVHGRRAVHRQRLRQHPALRVAVSAVPGADERHGAGAETRCGRSRPCARSRTRSRFASASIIRTATGTTRAAAPARSSSRGSALEQLHALGFKVSIARQMEKGENAAAVGEAYAALLAEHGLAEEHDAGRVSRFPAARGASASAGRHRALHDDVSNRGDAPRVHVRVLEDGREEGRPHARLRLHARRRRSRLRLGRHARGEPWASASRCSTTAATAASPTALRAARSIADASLKAGDSASSRKG